MTYNLLIRFVGIVFYVIALFSCAPARYVKPLMKGEHALQVDMGGPIAKVPGIGVIPLPLTTVGYGYGLNENLTLFGNLHTTSLLFGVVQADVGTLFRCWSTKQMGITLQPTLNVAVDCFTGANRFWPQFDANYYWDYTALRTKAKDSKGFYKIRSVYGGLSNWFDPYLTESQGRRNEQFWIPNIHIGHLWQRNQWVYQVEGKILAPIYSNEDIVVNYPSALGSRGALGAYFSLYYKLK